MNVIDIGSYAKYPKTGTVGTIVQFQQSHGHTFALLDSTGLFYRIDQLIPAVEGEMSKPVEKDKNMEQFRKEKELFEEVDFSDAALQQDGACHGGG
ncbi:MAG: DUF2098 domain-containing protein [Methanomicrobiales archaeon]|nr:DUF2098 domain-containing protein [Methanomicrobiales archaeon]